MNFAIIFSNSLLWILQLYLVKLNYVKKYIIGYNTSFLLYWDRVLLVILLDKLVFIILI